ncbi:MAG: hypothetical protein ACI9LM_000820 [Alteromonadaceae bacterium]|jgi:hypothetical protein
MIFVSTIRELQVLQRLKVIQKSHRIPTIKKSSWLSFVIKGEGNVG